jgi:outer membrane protein TolC
VLDLEILRSTEESSRSLLDTTRRLIEAQLTPAAELVQLEADLALREANRIVGERNLFLAIQQLGNELGLPAERIAELALPSDPFPPLSRSEVPARASILLAEAEARRADLLAAQERLAAEQARLVSAEDALEPRLDLVFTPSYTGLEEGAGGEEYFAALWTDVPGLSTTLGLSWSFPLRNRAAAGDLLRAEAAVRRRELLIEQIDKLVDSRIPAALETVLKNAERLEKLEQVVDLFRRTVENEEKKLRAGTSTLIDVISQRDRLTSALQSRNAAQLALAVALVELRFETGTLIAVDAVDDVSVRGEDFTTLPPEVVEP